MHVVLHFHELFALAHWTMMFQELHFTAHMIRGPATRGEKINDSLDRDAIKEEEMRGALCEGFCWKPALYTEKFLLRFQLDNAV